MRRLFALLLACALPLSGCAGGREEPAETYGLYFLKGDLSGAAGEGALRSAPSDIPKGTDAPALKTAEALMEALLLGPEDENLASTIPAGTSLLSLRLQGSRATVDLSAQYSSLSGVSLTLADYAITLTLTQIPEISLVTITVRGQGIAYRDRQSFAARDVLLYPEGDVVGTVEVTLYFPDGEGILRPEERALPLYEGDTQAEAVVQAVENGPESRGLLPAFPDSFRVRSVWLEEDICYVNLSSALEDSLEESGALATALDSLDQSLRSLEGIRGIRFLADGEFVQYYGGVSLQEPYEPELWEAGTVFASGAQP